MTNITTQITDELNHSLCLLAKELKQSPAYIVNKVIEAFVQELHEDIEDYDEILRRVNQNNKTIPWGQIQRECGLLF